MTLIAMRLTKFARAVLLGLIDDAHAALKNLADDFVAKFVLDGEQRHEPDVGKLRVDVKPAVGRKREKSPDFSGIFFNFLLARSPRRALIRAKSNDFCN